MSYTQLTQTQRYQIHTLLKMGHNQTEIADCLIVHKSTISREQPGAARLSTQTSTYHGLEQEEESQDSDQDAYLASG